MLTKEQIETYIEVADLELGPRCCDEWVEECRAILRAAVCADGGKGEAVARVQSYTSTRPFSEGRRVKEVVLLSDVADDALLYTAPQAECAPLPKQEPLGEPFQTVLDENRWNLYAGDE